MEKNSKKISQNLQQECSRNAGMWSKLIGKRCQVELIRTIGTTPPESLCSKVWDQIQITPREVVPILLYTVLPQFQPIENFFSF
jgi:hypothetical protein